MAEQLTFDWPAGVALTAGDFFVTEANAAAFVMVTHPDSWPERKLVLTGPAGSGKSHLARVFAAQSGANVIAAADLPPDPQFPDAPIVIEDADRLPPDRETALFHLHNHLSQGRRPLLLTARTLPGHWPIALPDLASRMQATTAATIRDPDEALLAAVIMKQLADRQITYPPDLPGFLAARIERSYTAAAAIVDDLDRTALRDRRKVNRALAREVLDACQPSG